VTIKRVIDCWLYSCFPRGYNILQLSLSLIFLAPSLSAVAQVNLLSNGSFESPAGATAYGHPTSWDPSNRPDRSEPSIIIQPNTNYPAAEDGNQYIGIGTEADGTHDFVAQTLSLASAGTYTLSWYDSAPYVGAAYTTAPYIVAVLNDAGDQVTSIGLDAYHGTTHPWVQHTMNIVISTPGSYTFEFTGNCPPSGLGACIDNVSLLQLLPDLAATSFTWDASLSEYDIAYTNTGAPLAQATTAKLFWAKGTNLADAFTNSPIWSASILAGFAGQASAQVPESYFNFPVSNATYLQLVLDPDNLISEVTKTNNTITLSNTFRHVVLVMMENRSFDHFLGWLPGAEGMQPGKTYTNASGQSFTNWHLTYFQGCGCGDPDHSYGGGRVELDTNRPSPLGACDGWLLANTNDIFSIGYYQPQDLAFLGQVAPNWTVCDHYFAAIMAETQPNRIYQHAAQTDSLTNRTDIQTGLAAKTGAYRVSLPTIWDTLSQSNVTGRYYYSRASFLDLWGPTKYGYLSSSSIPQTLDQFYINSENGTLPAVSFIDPAQTSATLGGVVYDYYGSDYGDDSDGNDDHPHSDIRNGEAFLTSIYDAIVSSPNWSSTVLIINFDEWGGFFDHVPPPKLGILQIPPAESALGNDGRLGYRVPCIVISPWSRRGYVSKEQFDHTSVLKMIENRWRLPALTVRDAGANDLGDVLDFDHPNFARPPGIANVPTGPFGGACQEVHMIQQPDGRSAVVWDATCFKVMLQRATFSGGLWTDLTNVLAPPYVLTQAELNGYSQGLFRFKVLK
jgi:phospholipase C